MNKFEKVGIELGIKGGKLVGFCDALEKLESACSEVSKEIRLLVKEPRLEVGKWYRCIDGSLFFFSKKSEFQDYSFGYGFTSNGTWLDERNGYSFVQSPHLWTKSSHQEVEEALVKEAKRRGLLHGVRFISPNGEDWGFKVTSNDFHFDAVNNTLSFTQDLGGTVFLFIHGHWAEPIIEIDKFAELKEAYAAGKIIQAKFTPNGKWIENLNPEWDIRYKYRIKPEEKPKVGDVCKFWDGCEDCFVISKLSYISEGSSYLYNDLNGESYCFARTLTKQEAIKLLFGKVAKP